MEPRGNRYQYSSDGIKEEPNSQNSSQALHALEHANGSASLIGRSAGDFLQAVRTDEAVVVFGNALSTVKTLALRTARHGFPGPVVKTTLIH
jgi:hypothetical protein